MGISRVLAAVVALYAATAASADAASFDCRRAVTKAEHAICDTASLSSMDETMARYYRALVDGPFHGPACRDGIRTSQKDWLRERDRCGDVGCLAARYTARIDTLRNAWTAGCGAS